MVQVLVSAELPGNKNIESIAGTGFFIAKHQYIATAAHVFTKTEKDLQNRGASRIAFSIRIPMKDVKNTVVSTQGFFSAPFEVIEIDEEHDLALVRTVKKIGRDGLHVVMTVNIEGADRQVELVDVSDVQFFSGRIAAGDDVAVAGFPLNTAYLLAQQGIVSALPVIPIPGTSREKEEIVLDITVNGGNSGGPAFLSSNGLVIGVCRAMHLAPVTSADGSPNAFLQSAGLALVTPAELLVRLAKKHGIETKLK